MTEVSIEYDLGQHGWSSFTLSAGDRAVEVGEFGDCTDALGDLVGAALLVATAALRAEARFDGEPMEWRLVIGEPTGWIGTTDRAARPPRPPPEVRLRVLTFADYLSDSPEAEGEALLDTRVTVDAFARAIRKAAWAIWDSYGPRGYDEAWNGPRGFPLRALRALDVALKHQDPPARESEPGPSAPTSV